MSNNINLNSALVAAFSLAVMDSAFAAQEADTEKCMIVDKDGKGIIKEHKGDCKASKHNCAGQNPAADPESWISMPKGLCERIEGGKIVEETKR